MILYLGMMLLTTVMACFVISGLKDAFGPIKKQMQKNKTGATTEFIHLNPYKTFKAGNNIG